MGGRLSKLDIHILVTDKTNKDWFSQCLASLEDMPNVAVHILQGTPYHTGLGRIRGFERGTYPYVAVVDPDDYVLPGGIESCIAALDANVKKHVAYTKQRRVDENDKTIVDPSSATYQSCIGTEIEPFMAHHLVVYRRAALPDLLFLKDFPTMDVYALNDRMPKDSFQYVDVTGYAWRMHKDNYHQNPVKSVQSERLRDRISQLTLEKVLER